MAEWVSVKHPPDLGSGFYLVWTDNTGVEKCRWSEGQKKWMGGAWTSHITHWRPMLASPEKPRTNADSIRAMDDEELAEFLDRVNDFPCEACCGNLSRCRRNNAPEPVCKRHYLEWLKEERQDV